VNLEHIARGLLMVPRWLWQSAAVVLMMIPAAVIYATALVLEMSLETSADQMTQSLENAGEPLPQSVQRLCFQASGVAVGPVEAPATEGIPTSSQLADQTEPAVVSGEGQPGVRGMSSSLGISSSDAGADMRVRAGHAHHGADSISPAAIFSGTAGGP